MSSRHIFIIIASVSLSQPGLLFAGDNSDFQILAMHGQQGVIRGSTIPGGELDYNAVTGENGSRDLILVWDGADSAPDILDPSGLGGIDLDKTCRIRMNPDSVNGRIRICDDQGRPASRFW